MPELGSFYDLYKQVAGATLRAMGQAELDYPEAD